MDKEKTSEKRALENGLKFIMRNSLYGINPKPPTVEQLISAGAFESKDNKETK